MTVHRINPDNLVTPSGFSHAVTAGGGTLVFLSGQTGVDKDGRITDKTLPGQFERALLNLLSALDAAGGHPAQLTRVTVYTTDIADYRANSAEVQEIWRKLVGPAFPAMTVLGVSDLWDEDALVALEAVALLPVTGRHHR